MYKALYRYRFFLSFLSTADWHVSPYGYHHLLFVRVRGNQVEGMGGFHDCFAGFAYPLDGRARLAAGDGAGYLGYLCTILRLLHYTPL